MFRYVSIFAIGAGLAFAQSGHGRAGAKQPRQHSESPAPVSAQSKPAEAAPAVPGPAVTVPAGASETSPGVYKHTDSSGKNWTYRKTPFGVVRSADGAAAEPAADTKANAPKRESPFAGGKTAPASAPVTKAVEDGDTVRFERSTPFGPTRWTRKRSELSADETEILEQSRARKTENAGTK
jgi:hypothetical protein